ncbi:TPA: transposase [Streptococcus equi subsp. zooepidemicus]|nr:transposase [Streptococcus equi subsp. zooepidemicus]HEL0443679.1 transposase [Streptococcus equi subsp. zooepidemicus]HEL0453852.1 transposase [Streptococcus equi subsp. zooepidemicus]HEL0595690.1 transposase [Streptococcus equi subsp. zooepidemicus]HEL0616024.1 transposase [Streptococcus equi subsp. zooepidemicus]
MISQVSCEITTTFTRSYYFIFKKWVTDFFGLIKEPLSLANHHFLPVFKLFLKYKPYITNALQLPYSNAKLEATNKMIKDMKRQAFGFRNFKNFKTKILIALNITKEKTKFISSRT